MQLAIEAQALTKRFRKLQTYRDLVLYPWRQADHLAVDGVSLQIERGQLFGLLGQNGAGKTTLIKMLCTALLPSSGSASVMGFDVVKQARQVRERIGLVNGEERSFYWRLTGRQNLEFSAAPCRLGRGCRSTVPHLLQRHASEAGHRAGLAWVATGAVYG
jgi:ABC-2 type transport system ATP-binding protein